MHEISHVIFSVFNEVHMAIACVLLGLINVYLSLFPSAKGWARRLKAFNWFLVALVFVLVFYFNLPVEIERSWLRFSFALLAIGEISYYGDVFMDVSWRVITKIKSRTHKKP